MSAARDLFAELFTHRPMLRPGDREAVETLRRAADLWRADGRFFSAGVCMSLAIHGAWGDGVEVDRCLVRALEDYKTCVDTQPRNSLESIAALRKWTDQLMYVEERSIASHWQRLLQQELAERLIKFFGETKHSGSYLVRGFILTTDLDGGWEVTFPEYEISRGSETMGAGQLSLEMTSGFHLLIALGDFAGAQDIVERCPDAFITPGLKGWRFATRGFLNPGGDAFELFNSAADSFAEDVEPSSEEIQKRGGSWDAKNITLWTKYFRARAAVARIVREPDQADQSLTEASELLEGTDSGFVHNQVWRFRVLVSALLRLLRGGVVDVDGMRQELLEVKRLFGVSSDDPIIEQFVDSAARAFEALRAKTGTDRRRVAYGT